MKLREALEIIQKSRPAGAKRARYLLGCSSSPTILQNLLQAHLLTHRPDLAIEVVPTVYGDLIGGLESFQRDGYTGAVVVCEWYDLDARLGFRRLGGWVPSLFRDITSSTRAALARLQSVLEKIATAVPVVVVLPTLPLPPLEICVPAQLGSLEAQLWTLAWEFASWCTSHSVIRLLNPVELDRQSPLADRFDLKAELGQGTPYRIGHASKLAEMICELLVPSPPLKGLITDLDDTLWDGILGEVGVSGVSFTLDSGAQIHGLYQQLLQSLAERGVLLAIASKNDVALAEQALGRTDLLLRRSIFFPIEVHWEPKSISVSRILKAWNINADAVAFIDDSALEAAEVQARFPQIRTLAFPKNDATRVPEFFNILRSWFGKPTIREEDGFRAESLQNNELVQASAGDRASHDAFLAGINARLSFQLSQDFSDRRAFELVNKTNQFNLNGRRISEDRWREAVSEQDGFLLTVSYIDKFGPLGKIAVLLGHRQDHGATVSTWVMSCRAFSRRIEHATLHYLFERLAVDRISFEFEATERNLPVRQFFSEMHIPEAAGVLLRTDFEALCPPLPHAIEEVSTHA